MKNKNSKVLYASNDTEDQISLQMLPLSEAKENTFAADNSVLSWRIKNLTGRILTIIDAAIADREQKKAIKDLIRQTMMDEFEFYANFFFEGLEPSEEDIKSGVPITPEEILGS